MTSTTEAQVLDIDSGDSEYEAGPRAARQSIWHVSLTLMVAMAIGIAAGG